LGEAHLEARAWFREQINAAGLALEVDPAGNHLGHLNGGPKDTATFLLGSHLDSVAYGGRFDGALGTLAALEALTVIREAQVSLPVNLAVIDFSDEEGSLIPLMGSRALAGTLRPEHLENPLGGPEALQAGLKRAGLQAEGLLNAGRPPGSLAGYLELHIEQGLRLEEAGAQIGVVSGIVGIGFYHLTFIGRADHAGTTSMEARLDAAQGAASFIQTARRSTMAQFPGCVATVGRMQLEPGATNIVPARASLTLEFRAPDENTFRALEHTLLGEAATAAAAQGLKLNIEHRGEHLPAPMSPIGQAAIAEAARALDLKTIDLHSGAGHDAQSLAAICPVGMLFIPSVDGASHSAREFSTWQDCINGANVLLQAALHMAQRLG
jgi:N-carbamoyl-L-amino-acid hydrolase